ncbi:MAG TPA: hypothetical protein VII20_04745 [Roseiarcus sp.]
MTAAIALGAGSAAEAAIGDGVLGARQALANATQIENAQFIFGGQNYCWYDDGWRGPGWYWCGYANRSGLGWGGGVGWHGWRRGGGHGGGFRPGGGHGGVFHGAARPGGHVGGRGGHGGGHGPRRH